ncbi:MAG: hypothetical protein HC925_05720 [Coleofasciculaceae cyanobacterium SM2_3_26]|nr:hypothetical protein [Coleofasciculaceae cyanobacterium SM2_3_26]
MYHIHIWRCDPLRPYKSAAVRLLDPGMTLETSVSTPDISHLMLEGDRPADNFQSEKQ